MSVPVWGVTLSRPLPIIGLVGHYPTNYLIGRGPIQERLLRAFDQPNEWLITCGISYPFG